MQEEHHRHKRSLKTYTVEVCLIADYQAFSGFLERNNNDVVKAETEMRNYYAFIAEKMKVRYHHINEVEGTIAFNIVYSGLIIIQTRTDSSYSEPFKTDNTLEVDVALNQTQFFLESPPPGIVLPPSDHYMFFTGYDLVSNGNTGNAGKAYTGIMCIADKFVFPGTTIKLKGSTSIVEDKQGAQTAQTAAHELGHALNALHDSQVGCKDSNQYIMATSSGSISNPALARHPWQFSTCSVKDIKTFVQGSDVDCLNDNRYGDDVVTSTERAGQYYDKDTQCKLLKGETSRFCDAFYTDDKPQMCYRGYCLTETLPGGGYRCGTVQLMEYSTCDTNKWCYKGLCINANNSAPIFFNVPTSPVQVASNAQGLIYTAQTFDTDGDVLSLHITYDPSIVSSYLAFDTSTKRFSVRQGANLADLQLSNFSLIMSVDDGLLLSLPVNVDFDITAPITNQPPSFTMPSYNFTVNEGKAGTIVVSTLLNRVTDPDANTQFHFILRLVTSNSNYFAIDPSSGRITYAQDYDYDPTRLPNNVQLSVEVRDQTGFADTTNIFLTILNVDQPPVFTNLPTSVNLPENTAPGSLVINVLATDNDSTDTIRFFFTTSSSFIRTYLDLNTNTGVITLKAGSILNYEQLSTKIFQVPIRASTPLASRDATLTIFVTNVNEPPTFTRSSYEVTTTTGPKDQVVVGSLTGVAFDPDAGDRIVEFGIEPGRYVYLFNIDRTSGRITFSQEYGTDRSVFPRQVALVVTARDTTGLKGTAVYTITINIGNRKPTLSNLPNTISVSENTTGGTFIFQALAQDLDGDMITYLLQAAIPANQNQFDVSSAGIVRVRSGAVIDFESLPELMYLTIAAFDGKASSTAANLTLVITNVNEPPSFNETSVTFNVQEGKAGVTLVQSLLPYLRDPDRNESFNFAITQFDQSSYFFINDINGAISYNKNYDTDPTRLPSTIQLAVTATDSGGNKAGITIVLQIQNVNQSPLFTNLPARIAVYTATTTDGSVIFNVGATDMDTQDTLTISSNFITSEASRFLSYRSTDRAVLFTEGSSFTSNSTFVIRFTLSDNRVSILADLTVDVVVPTPTTTPVPTTTETPLEITNLPTLTSINENTNGAFFAFSINRADMSTISFQLVQTDASLPQLFVVNNAGVVSVKVGATIDYETLPNRIVLFITAREDAITTSPKNLTIVIRDLNENPKFSQSAYNFIVDEGQKDANLISSLEPFVTDQDSADSTTFNILPSQYSNYFKIDPSIGRIAYAVDYDTDPNRLPNTVVLSVQVTDNGGLADITNFRFNIRNINQRPVFTNLPAFRTINTDFTSGVFYTVSAIDTDSGDGLTISMDSSVYFSFSQNGNTLRFHGRQGITATQNFQLTFIVTDGQLSTLAVLTVTVFVEVPMTTTTIRPLMFTNLPQSIVLPENLVANPVFTVITNEPDRSKLAFQMQSNPDGVFQINNNGEVSRRTGVTLDYEQFPSGMSLRITCTDGRVTANAAFLDIFLRDLNEPPRFSQQQYNFTAAEGKRGQILVTSLTSSVTDPDANERFAFNLLTSQYSPYFIMDQSNGRISFAEDYDADAQRLPFMVLLTARVVDKGGNEATARIQFTFTDINQPPYFTNLPSTQIIQPSVTARVVFTVQWSDQDTDDTVAVSISYANPTDANFLTFNQANGDVTFTRNAGITGNQTFTLTFTVSDGRMTSSSTLTLQVFSEPETTTVIPTTTTSRPLRITNLPVRITVIENTINGVFTVRTDVLPTTNLSFSMSSPYFNISDDGTVSVKPGVVLDYEKSPRIYQLRITATDGVVASPEETLTIQLGNDNEPPKFNSSDLYFSTNEGKAGDPVIKSLLPFVTDEDNGDTLFFEFLPRGLYQKFIMNSSTGAIEFASEYDVFNHRYDRIGLNIKVTDSGQLSDEAYMQLTINFVNQAPKFVNLPQSLTIPSITGNGETIFTVQVVDTDMFDVITVDTILLTPEASQFFNFRNMGKEVDVTFQNGENIASDSTFQIQFIATDIRFTVNSILTIIVTYIPQATTSTQLTSITTEHDTTATEQDTTSSQVTSPQPPAPAFNQSRYSFIVNDGEKGDVVIPSLLPFMTDSNPNRAYKFSIIPATYSDAFNINASTGEITFATNYDLTQLPGNVALQILVSDLSNSIQFTTTLVNLVIVPKNNVPEFQNLPGNVTIPGSTKSGEEVFTVSVTDKDNNAVLEVRMRQVSSESESMFTFDALSRAVTVASNVMFLTSRTYILEFTVDDGKDEASANLTIIVVVSQDTTMKSTDLPTSTGSEQPTTKPTEEPTTTQTEGPTTTQTEGPTTTQTEGPTTTQTEGPTTTQTEGPTTTQTEIPTSYSTDKPTTKSPAIPTDSDSLLNKPWAISAIIIVVVLVPVVIVIVLFLICRKAKTKDESTDRIYDTRSTGTRSIPISYYPSYNYKTGSSRFSGENSRLSGVEPHHYPFDYLKQSSIRSKASTQSS